MAQSPNGDKMNLRDNKDFRSITPNEFVPEGTLVWSDRDWETRRIVSAY